MDNNDLTLRQLKFASWYLFHKDKIKKTLIIFLIVFNVGLFFFDAYKFIVYYRGAGDYQKMLEELTKNRINVMEMHKHFEPKNLLIGKVNVIRRINLIAGGKNFNYDFISQIKNPNANWIIPKINFDFTFSGNKLDTQETFILPGQEKYVFASNQQLSEKPGISNLEITKVSWKRLHRRDKKKLEILKKIFIKNASISYIIPKGKTTSVPQISFDIENSSVYSFWEMNLIIALYQQNRLVGIDTLLVRKLLGGEKRRLNFIWHGLFPTTTDIEIVPDINVFDSSVFIQ